MDTTVFSQYKDLDHAALDAVLQNEIQHSARKIVVLDDDPTGTQTVHDISVYTDWDYESVKQGFLEPQKLFYILTNSRSFSADKTVAVHQEIAHTIARVAKETNTDYLIISRSDSTLRGHYPLETEVLKEVYEAEHDIKMDGEILCPFFKEGGRYTMNDIHYVAYGQELTPAAETEFAKDSTFGYSHSFLPDYIEEKTGGNYKAQDVLSISLDMLRNEDYAQIETILMEARDFNKIIVNAIDYCDLKVFCIALYHALAKGKQFVFRSAASLVKVIGGISDHPLLKRENMITGSTQNGGLVVIGSYTNKTTQQFEALQNMDKLLFIEFDSDLVLAPAELANELKRVNTLAESAITSGTTTVIYTKRRLLQLVDDTKEAVLARSTKISEAVQSIVADLSVEPAFILAKGGITSSDICTRALGVKHGLVLGQAAPGIPVLKTDGQSKFPGIPYIIFPGNVGDDLTLRRILEIFS